MCNWVVIYSVAVTLISARTLRELSGFLATCPLAALLCILKAIQVTLQRPVQGTEITSRVRSVGNKKPILFQRL